MKTNNRSHAIWHTDITLWLNTVCETYIYLELQLKQISRFGKTVYFSPDPGTRTGPAKTQSMFFKKGEEQTLHIKYIFKNHITNHRYITVVILQYSITKCLSQVRTNAVSHVKAGENKLFYNIKYIHI